MKKKEIDVLDIQILNILQTEADITNKDLAERIGLTPGPTLTRVRNLIERGSIKSYAAEINFNYFGYQRRAIYKITILSEHKNPLETYIQKKKNILFCVETALNNSNVLTEYLFTMVCKTAAQCKKISEEILEDIPGITNIECFVGNRIVKESKFLLDDQEDLIY